MVVVYLFFLSSLTACYGSSDFHIRLSHDALDELATHLNSQIEEYMKTVIFPGQSFTGPLGLSSITIGPTISLASLTMGDLIISLDDSTQKIYLEIPNLYMRLNPVAVSASPRWNPFGVSCDGMIAAGADDYDVSFSLIMAVDECQMSVASVHSSDIVIDPGTTLVDIYDTKPFLCKLLAETGETFIDIFNDLTGVIIKLIAPYVAGEITIAILEFIIASEHQKINEMVTVCFTDMAILSEHVYLGANFSMGTGISSNETTPEYATLATLVGNETGLVDVALLFIGGGLILGCCCGACIHRCRNRKVYKVIVLK